MKPLIIKTNNIKTICLENMRLSPVAGCCSVRQLDALPPLTELLGITLQARSHAQLCAAEMPRPCTVFSTQVSQLKFYSAILLYLHIYATMFRTRIRWFLAITRFSEQAVYHCRQFSNFATQDFDLCTFCITWWSIW